MKKDLIIIYLFERYKIDFIIQEKNEIISIGEKIVIIHDLYELEKEVEDINFRKRSFKNIIKIEQWCKEEFEGKPEYSRRTPSKGVKDPREKTLGSALSHFKQTPIWINYQKGKNEGLSREEIKQKYELREGQIKLVERYERLIEEYDLDDYLKNVMKIEEWCKEKFEGKPEYSKRTPSTEAKDPREKILGKALSRFKQNRIWTDYQKGKEEGLSREEIKRKYGLREGEMQLVERYDRLIEEYGKKKKITGQDIGKASCTTNVQKCDDVQADLNGLIKKQQTKEGGQH